MMWALSLGVTAFVLGYLYGRRITRQELRIIDLYMEQLERIKESIPCMRENNNATERT